MAQSVSAVRAMAKAINKRIAKGESPEGILVELESTPGWSEYDINAVAVLITYKGV